MRVLMINPETGDLNPQIPLGIAYIAAYLRKHDIDVKIIDNNLHKWNRERLSALIKGYEPDIVGTGGTTVQCNSALEIGKLVKRIDKSLRIVYGGVHFTFRPEDGLKYGDLCVTGEGERTFLEICREDNLYKIKGIAFRENENIISTEPRPFIDNLDEIPFPAYDLLEMDKYRQTFMSGERAIDILTGRGCPYNCVFCGSPRFWKRRVRFHSIDYVISHIKYLIENYNLRNLAIHDDTFTVSKERVLEFCDKIEENQLRLNMTCLASVKESDYEVFKRMKDAGFSMVAFGVESGNNNILRMVNKGITTDDTRRAIASAKKAGLSTKCLFMIGNICEDENTIMDSIDFAKEVNAVGSNSDRYAKYNHFELATPFPGSEFFEICRKYGRLTVEKWDGSIDWDMYRSIIRYEKPVFVPNSLDENVMLKLRELAFDETNLAKFSWIPKIVKRNTFIQKVYRRLVPLKGD